MNYIESYNKTCKENNEEILSVIGNAMTKSGEVEIIINEDSVICFEVD